MQNMSPQCGRVPRLDTWVINNSFHSASAKKGEKKVGGGERERRGGEKGGVKVDVKGCWHGELVKEKDARGSGSGR